MRKTLILRGLLAVLCLLVAAVTVFRLNPWNIRGVQPSELYLQYKDLPGIQASFIKDKQINDSVTVSVTLLQATDSAWQQLMDSIWSAIPSREDRDFLMHQSPITTKYIPKGHLNCPMDTASLLNNDLIAIDINQNTVAIFHLDNESQIPAIIRHHLKEVKNNKTTKK